MYQLINGLCGHQCVIITNLNIPIVRYITIYVCITTVTRITFILVEDFQQTLFYMAVTMLLYSDLQTITATQIPDT